MGGAGEEGGQAYRKYIGVVFERGGTLPSPPGRERRRRLGLVGRVRGGFGDEGEGVVAGGGGEVEVPVSEQRRRREGGGAGLATLQQDVGTKAQVPLKPQLKLSQGYQYRESNWSIGRAAERAGVKVREYKRGDRFLAWRKLNARKARNAEKRALSSRKGKGKGKGGKKK